MRARMYHASCCEIYYKKMIQSVLSNLKQMKSSIYGSRMMSRALGLLFVLLLVFPLSLRSQEAGSSCLTPQVISDTSTPLTISEAGEHWFKISLDLLPMGVFYPSDVTGEVLKAEVDFHCDGIPYSDHTLEAAVKMIEKDNGVTMPFTVKFDETERGGVHGYELIISNKYKTLLMAYGILYETYAYVKITIPEAVAPDPEDEPVEITPITGDDIEDCMEGAEYVRVGDKITVPDADGSTVHIIPLSTWIADTVLISWDNGGNGNTLRMWVGESCGFQLDLEDPQLLKRYLVGDGETLTFTPGEMSKLMSDAGAEDVFVKFYCPLGGQVTTKRPDHTVAVDRDGLSKATAFEFDWINGNDQPAGEFWYHLSLDTLYDYEGPDMAYHIVNLSDIPFTAHLTAQAAGEEESKDIALHANEDWYRHENASMFIRMNVHDVYYIIRSEQPVHTYAQVSESGVSDPGCLEAIAFNWEDGNDQAANKSKWYAIDMRPVMRLSERKDVEVNIVNMSDVVNPSSIDISLNCPSTGVTSYETNLAARDTLTRTIGSGMLKSIADSVVYVKLTAEQAVHVFAEAVDVESGPVWEADACADAYRLLVDGEYTYPYTHITMVGGVRDTADLGDTLLYKIKVEDLRGRKMLPEVVVTNLGNKSVTINGEVSFECPAYSVQKQSVTLAAGASNVAQIDKSMVDGVSAEYIYVRMWAEQPFSFSARLKSTNEGTACLTARDFEWNKDILQNVDEPGTPGTYWYSIDIAEAKATRSDVFVRITNRSNETMSVTADLAFDCPYADLMTQKRTIAGGESMERKIDYSTFAMLGSAYIYVAVTAEQNVTLYGEMVAREHVAPDSACLYAIPYDWENGMRIQSTETKDTTWIALDMDTLRSTTLMPKIVITNHCGTNISFEGMFIVECPDSIGGQKRSFSLQGDSTYSKTMSRDMLRQLDPNVETGYIRIIATGSCLDYSFRVEMIQPDAGVSCQMPITFNWVTGHDQEADKSLWYEVDLTQAKQLKKDITLIMKNKTSEACSLEVAYAPDCPCEQPQTAALRIEANAQSTRTIPYSMFETMGSRIWVRLSTCTAVHFEARLDDPEPFDEIACPDDDRKVNLTFDTEYTYPVAGANVGDTIFYVITGAELDTLRKDPQLSIRSHVSVGDCGAQTVKGMIYYHCPITSKPLEQTISLSAGQDRYKLLERSMIEQMVSQDSIIVMLTSTGCFTFEAELYNPNSGQDCSHAIREDLGCTIQEAGETKWYRYDVSRLSKMDTMLTVEVINLSATELDVVSVTAYGSCGGEKLLSRSTKIAVGDTVRKEIPADMLLGVSSDYAYLQISSTQQTKVCLNGKEYEPFGPIFVENEVEVVPNILLENQMPDSVWYTVNVGSLLADTCWQEATIRVRNMDTKVAHLYGELAWEYVVTHAMTTRNMTINVGDSIYRTITRADLEKMRDKTPLVRLTSDAKIDILLSADLCEIGEVCLDPITIDWQYGNLHQSSEGRWYAFSIPEDSLVAHASDALVINFANVATEQTVTYADLYHSCLERDPFEHLQDTLAAGESRTRVLYNCAVRKLVDETYSVVFSYRSKLTTRINFAWVPAWMTDSIYDEQEINFAEEPTYEWRGQTLTEPGVYFDTIPYTHPMFAECDSSRYMIQLVAKVVEKDTICDGDVLEWHNMTLDSTGVYYDTIRFVESKYLGLPTDSVRYEMHLKEFKLEKDSLLDTTVHVLSLPFLWRGQSLTRDTVNCRDTVFYEGTKHCVDSLFTLNLTIEQVTEKYDTTAFCIGDTLFWHNDTIIEAGTTNHYDTVYSIGGVDSIYYYLNATRLDTLSAVPDTVKMCFGDSLLWRNIWYKEAGIYRDTTHYPEPYGCDSVYYTLHLSFFDAATFDTLRTTVHEYDLPYSWRGKSFSNDTTCNDTILYPNAQCIKELYTLELNVMRVEHVYDTLSYCVGDTLFWRNDTILAAGTTNHYDTLFTILHKDSICYALNATRLDTVSAPIEEITLCNGDSLLWHGKYYNIAGTYNDTTHYPEPYGCDSVFYTLKLLIRDVRDTTETDSICPAATYRWRGRDWPISSNDALTTVYTFHDTARYAGTTDCDSLRFTMNVTVFRPTYTNNLDTTICKADVTSFRWKPNNVEYADFSVSEVRYDTVRAFLKPYCDSIISCLKLTVQKPLEDTTRVEATICYNSSYEWFGREYSAAGIYDTTLTYAKTGCDSAYYRLTLHVRELPDTIWESSVRVCDGSSIQWRGKWISDSGVYTDTLKYKGTDCDSLYYKVNVITLKPAYADTLNVRICPNSSYTWRGRQYSTDGWFNDTIYYNTPDKCDSIIYTLHVDVFYPTVMPVETRTICNGETYEWHGTKYTQTGTYTYTVPSSLGCDSLIYTLQLERQAPMTSVKETMYICGSGSVEWELNHKTYSSAGLYYDTLQNVNGCDSIAGELRVIVQQATTNPMETATIYEGEVYEWHGMQLDEAGVYEAKEYYATSGCDSVIYNLTLTVDQIPETSSDITMTVCPGTEMDNHTITSHTVWSDTTVIDHGDGTKEKMITNYDIDVYTFDIPENLLEGSVSVHCGSPVLIRKALKTLDNVLSDPSFAPNVQVTWTYLQNSGMWMDLDTTVAIDGTTTTVGVRCMITSDCGEITREAWFNVDSTSSYETVLYDYLPVVVLYGGGTYMVDKNDVLNRYRNLWSNEPADQDVWWYKQIGKLDDWNDPDGERNDEAKGWGWYFVPQQQDQSLAPGASATYYALIKHVEVQGTTTPCTVTARTVSVGYNSTSKITPNIADANTNPIITIYPASMYKIEVQTAAGVKVWSGGPAASFVANFGRGTFIVMATDQATGNTYRFTLMLY